MKGLTLYNIYIYYLEFTFAVYATKDPEMRHIVNYTLNYNS